MFVTLTESGFHRNLGFTVKQQKSEIRNDAYWFGEAQGRVVVTVTADKVGEFENSVKIPFEKLGTVNSENIIIDNESWGSILSWKEKYDNTIGNLLKAK